MPNAEKPFRLEVFFSGLVFFVQQGDRITHVVLRDGREHRNDLAHHLSDPEPGSPFQAEDFHHTPLLRVKVGIKDDSDDADVVEEPLKWNRVSFEWRDGSGKRVLPEDWKRGATPFGTPNDTRQGMPDPTNYESFYWLSSLEELKVTNRVRRVAYDNQGFKDGILAQVPLEGGDLRSSVFAWAEERGSAGEKQRLIPRLEFAAARGMAGPIKRAAAEGITWRVEAPEGAKHLVILKEEQFGSTEVQSQAVHSFEVVEGKKARVGLTNYPKKRQDVDPSVPHPGRGRGVGSLHFGMLYDLVKGPVSPGDRHIPWIPSNLQGNSLPYVAELGNPFRARKQLVGSWDSPAVTLFLKDNRPICVEGTAKA